MGLSLGEFDAVYYITDNQLFVSISGQAHLPVDPNELVAGYEKRIAEVRRRLTSVQPDLEEDAEAGVRASAGALVAMRRVVEWLDELFPIALDK